MAEGLERKEISGVAGDWPAAGVFSLFKGRTTLWARIFWLLMPMVFLLLVLHGIVILRQYEQLVTDEFMSQGELMAKNLAFSSELGVFAEDKELLEERMRGAAVGPDVAFIYIYGDGGEVLAKGGKQIGAPGDLGSPLQAARMVELAKSPETISAELTFSGNKYFEFLAPIYSEGAISPDELLLGPFDGKSNLEHKRRQRLIGAVHLILSSHRVEQQIFAILKPWILATVVTLLLCTLAIYIFSRRITRPVARLTDQAKMISDGVLDQEIPVESRDEIGQLAGTFNQMGAALKRNIDEKGRVLEELQDLNRNLEDRISERTAELEQRSLELQHMLEEVRAIGKISRAVSSTLDIQEVLTTIVAGAVELSESDGGLIYEYDDTLRVFQVRAACQIDDEIVNALKSSPVDAKEGVLGQAAFRREPVQIPDISSASDRYPKRLQPLFEKSGHRSLIAIPLLVQQRVIGGLVIMRREIGSFPPNVVNMLHTVANHSVIAFRNAQLFREIEDKGQQLQIASEHKSQFLANMSHELRTPLNAILGYTELVLDDLYGDVPEEIRGVLTRVEHNGQHLLGLINDILDLSKIEAGQLNLSFEQYSMKEVVHTTISAVEPLAEEKGLQLSTLLDEELPFGWGDEMRISQIILNLLGNALKFTEEGEVGVRVSASDGVFLFSVFDTGPGISEAHQRRIFEEFHQIDSTNTKEKGGTGLGLAISQRFVELHGGCIWVESILGQGSTFWFMLPVRADLEGMAR